MSLPLALARPIPDEDATLAMRRKQSLLGATDGRAVHRPGSTTPVVNTTTDVRALWDPFRTLSCWSNSFSTGWTWWQTVGMTANEALLARIVVDPAICFGKPTIKGHRIWVSLILDLLAAGSSVGEVIGEYPQLTEDDVRACIAYGARLADVRFVDLDDVA